MSRAQPKIHKTVTNSTAALPITFRDVGNFTDAQKPNILLDSSLFVDRLLCGRGGRQHSLHDRRVSRTFEVAVVAVELSRPGHDVVLLRGAGAAAVRCVANPIAVHEQLGVLHKQFAHLHQVILPH